MRESKKLRILSRQCCPHRPELIGQLTICQLIRGIATGEKCLKGRGQYVHLGLNNLAIFNSSSENNWGKQQVFKSGILDMICILGTEVRQTHIISKSMEFSKMVEGLNKTRQEEDANLDTSRKRHSSSMSSQDLPVGNSIGHFPD